MSAANHDLVIDQGSTFVIDLTIKESGSIKNLTGFSARSQLRSSKTASAVAASFTCTIANPTSGVVKMELPATTSTAMTAGVYFYVGYSAPIFTLTLLASRISMAVVEK